MRADPYKYLYEAAELAEMRSKAYQLQSEKMAPRLVDEQLRLMNISNAELRFFNMCLEKAHMRSMHDAAFEAEMYVEAYERGEG